MAWTDGGWLAWDSYYRGICRDDVFRGRVGRIRFGCRRDVRSYGMEPLVEYDLQVLLIRYSLILIHCSADDELESIETSEVRSSADEVISIELT